MLIRRWGSNLDCRLCETCTAVRGRDDNWLCVVEAPATLESEELAGFRGRPALRLVRLDDCDTGT